MSRNNAVTFNPVPHPIDDGVSKLKGDLIRRRVSQFEELAKPSPPRTEQFQPQNRTTPVQRPSWVAEKIIGTCFSAPRALRSNQDDEQHSANSSNLDLSARLSSHTAPISPPQPEQNDPKKNDESPPAFSVNEALALLGTANKISQKKSDRLTRHVAFRKKNHTPIKKQKIVKKGLHKIKNITQQLLKILTLKPVKVWLQRRHLQKAWINFSKFPQGPLGPRELKKELALQVKKLQGTIESYRNQKSNSEEWVNIIDIRDKDKIKNILTYARDSGIFTSSPQNYEMLKRISDTVLQPEELFKSANGRSEFAYKANIFVAPHFRENLSVLVKNMQQAIEAAGAQRPHQTPALIRLMLKELILKAERDTREQPIARPSANDFIPNEIFTQIQPEFIAMKNEFIKMRKTLKHVLENYCVFDEKKMTGQNNVDLLQQQSEKVLNDTSILQALENDGLSPPLVQAPAVPTLNPEQRTSDNRVPTVPTSNSERKASSTSLAEEDFLIPRLPNAYAPQVMAAA